MLSHVRLFVTPRTAARQAPLSLENPGKNTGVGCHFFLQGIVLNQGLNPHRLCVPALAGRFFTTEPPGKPPEVCDRSQFCFLFRGLPSPVHGAGGLQASLVSSAFRSYPCLEASVWDCGA